MSGFAFVRCVARAAAERGVGRLTDEPAGGPYLDEVAQLAAQYYQKRKKPDPKGEIAKLVKAGPAAAAQEARAAAFAAVPNASGADRLSLERDLAQVPAAVGKAGVTDFGPEQVRKALPPLPAFRRGAAVPGRPEWKLAEWLGPCDVGEAWKAACDWSPAGRLVRFGTAPGAGPLVAREAAVAAGVAKDGGDDVVPLLDADPAAEVPWLMYEFVPGDLTDRAAPLRWLAGPERVREVVALLREAAAAVGRLHKLTPPLAHGAPTAADLRYDPKVRRFRVTGFGRVPVAPNPRGDVKALGAIAYQLLADNPDGTPGPRAGVELKAEGVPEPLIRLIGESTDGSPAKRPADAAAFAAGLDTAARAPPRRAAAAAAPLPVPEPVFNLGDDPLAMSARPRRAAEDDEDDAEAISDKTVTILAGVGLLFVGVVLGAIVVSRSGKKDHHPETAEHSPPSTGTTTPPEPRIVPPAPTYRVKPPVPTPKEATPEENGTARPETKDPEKPSETVTTKPKGDEPPGTLTKPPAPVEPAVSPPPRPGVGLKREFTYDAGKAGVTQLAVSPDGSKVAAGSLDDAARVFDAASGKVLFTAAKQLSPVRAVAFSTDGTRFASGCGDGNIRVYDATGKFLYLCQRDTGELRIEAGGGYPGHKTGVRAVAFGKDREWLVTGGEDGTARVWDGRGKCRVVLRKGHTAPVVAVAFSPDGTRVVTGSLDGTAKVWDVREKEKIAAGKNVDKELAGWTAPGPVAAVAFTPGGKQVVAGSEGGAAVFDPATGAVAAELTGHKAGVVSLAFTPDRKRLLTGGADGSLGVWEVGTWKPLAVRGGMPPGAPVGVVREGRIGAVAAGPGGEVGLWLLPAGWPPKEE